ncbi:MAG TPA: hypothetical protein VGD81_01645 [Opitutaceae bacterium]
METTTISTGVTEKVRFRNSYHCTACDTSWTDTHDCACNDRCPKCRAEIEPESSDEITAQVLPLYCSNADGSIFSVENVSGIPDDVHRHPVNMDDPGADLLVFIADTDGEAAAFTQGLDVGVLGDDNSYVHEHLADGREIVIVHFGDSDDSNVRGMTKTAEVPLCG